MNNREERYANFALCREMLEAADVLVRFDPACAEVFARKARKEKRILFTGEGSSRIFPAKRAVYELNKSGLGGNVFTEGSTQAMEYDLTGCAVFGASNSGKTKEILRLFTSLKSRGHKVLFGLTSNPGTPLEELASLTHVLSCGVETAVAATKSSMEQALFYMSLAAFLSETAMPDPAPAAADLERVLTMEIDPQIVSAVSSAAVIYFAGRNNGVAEELTLKANEITRTPSAFLEGTYAFHGIEDVLTKQDVMIVIDPLEEEEEKYAQSMVRGVGMKVLAVASRQTMFPTVIIPEGGAYKEFLQLAAGWNLLVEAGLNLGIDLDHPARAKKVGYE